jgi:hypothetical protein
VPIGSYTVTEGALSAGFKLESLTCTATGSGSGSQDGSKPLQADITIAAGGDSVTCTYVNAAFGEVKIIKHTDPRGLDQSFSYTANLSGTCTQSTATAFTLNDTGNTTSDSAANTQDCTNVPVGNYTVTEGAEPANFSFEGLTCSATGTGSSGAQNGTVAQQADITLAPGGVVTCTYTNQGLGAIEITKASSKAAATPLAGAKFTVKDPGGNALTGSPFTTNSSGQVCVDHLPFGAYSVQETTAPAGYAIDDGAAHSVSVSALSSCGDGHEATFSATDTPLTDLLVKATSEAQGGTQSTITCVNSSNANIGNSPQGPSPSPEVDANGATALKPGTYTCTVVVDP